MLYHLSYRPNNLLLLTCNAIAFLAEWETACLEYFRCKHGEGTPRVCAAFTCNAFRRSDIRMPQHFLYCQHTARLPPGKLSVAAGFCPGRSVSLKNALKSDISQIPV